MRNVFITTIATLAIAGVAHAEGTAPAATGPVISGEVEMKFAETNDKGNEYKVFEDDLSAQTRSISPIH